MLFLRKKASRKKGKENKKEKKRGKETEKREDLVDRLI